MPWTKDDYPDDFKNLEECTRNKAIEIANALLDDDFDESRSIAIAITQAKVWASKRIILKSHGDNQHIIPHGGKWAILSEGSYKINHMYDTKEQALKKAKEIVKKDSKS